MSSQDGKRNKRDNTDQLNDIFVGGFDQEFGDELFVENTDLADELFTEGEHLDQAFMSGTGINLESHYQLELDDVGSSRRVDDGDIDDDVTDRLASQRLAKPAYQDRKLDRFDDDDHDVVEVEELVDIEEEEISIVAELIEDPLDEERNLRESSRQGRPYRSSRKSKRPAKNNRRAPTSKVDTAMIVLPSSSNRAPSPRRIRSRLLIAIWAAIVVFPLAVSALTYTEVSSRPDSWKVRAEIQYRGSAWTETQDIAIQSRSLIAPVAEQFDIPITEFEKNLDAGLLTGTQVLRIEYTSTDGQQAEEIVTALAASYITRTSELTPDGVFETLENQRTEIEQSLRLAKRRQSEIPAGIASKLVAERAAVAAEIDALEQRLTVVESKILDVSLDNLDLNANRVPILLTEPFRFSEPVSPNPTVWAGASFVVAVLMSGAAAALVLIYVSKRNKTWLGALK